MFGHGLKRLQIALRQQIRSIVFSVCPGLLTDKLSQSIEEHILTGLISGPKKESLCPRFRSTSWPS